MRVSAVKEVAHRVICIQIKSNVICHIHVFVMTLGETQMQTQEADGWSLRCLINPKGIGKRMVVDRLDCDFNSMYRAAASNVLVMAI